MYLNVQYENDKLFLDPIWVYLGRSRGTNAVCLLVGLIKYIISKDTDDNKLMKGTDRKLKLDYTYRGSCTVQWLVQDLTL